MSGASKSVMPLTLEPDFSTWARTITFSGFLLAMISVAALPWGLPITAFLISLLFIAFVYVWREHHALNGKPVSVRLDSTGNWYWLENEQRVRLELLGDSYHAPFLVILNFKPEGKRRRTRTLLLTTDNIDPSVLRRLRVYLNWQRDNCL